MNKKHPTCGHSLRRAAAGLTAALATLTAAGAYADDRIEEIVVRGQYLAHDQLNSVKTPTPIIDVPQSLSIMTEAQIRDQAFQNFGDILRYTPGLSISQGEGHRDAIIIRGIQSTADFFVDGMRDDVQYFRPLYNVQQVEVLRGANALLFGRGGGGGVINRVQKKPVLDDRFTALSLSGDTFGAYNTAIDSNLALGSRAAFRFNGYFQGLDNHRDEYDGESFALNPTLSVAISDDTTLQLSYELVDDDRVVDRGVPSRNVDGGPDKPLQGYDETFFGSASENETTLEAHLLRARLDHNFNESMRGNVTLKYADYDKLYQNLYASEEVVVTNGSFSEVELDGYRDTTDRENLMLQANLVSEFNTGAFSHMLLFGLEAGRQETANARDDNVFTVNGSDQLAIPFSDPLVIPEFAFTNPVRDRKSDVDIRSVYLQDQIGLTDNFKLVLGLRWDEFDIDVLDIREAMDGDAVDGNFSRKDSEVTPRYGVIYKPAENVSIYASYSETFLPRSGDQFLTLDLDSESTRPQFFENREIGVKWDINPRLSLTAAAFELERESFTSVDPDDPGQVIVVEGSNTEGFELQLIGNLTRNWAVNLGYAYLDSEVNRTDGSGTDGNTTAQTPDSMFSLWSSYQLSEALRLAVGVTQQDSFFVREDNSVEVPGFTRVDVAAYYQLSDALRLQLNIENLFDREYFPDAHSNDNISTGEPLNARLSVVFEF